VGRTSRAAIWTKLIWSAERVIRAAESEHFVAAGQGSGGTSVDGSIVWRAGEGKSAVVGISGLEDSLSFGSGEGEDCCGKKL
jgi:hypothetical protein